MAAVERVSASAAAAFVALSAGADEAGGGRGAAPLPALRQRLNNGKKLLSSHVETVGDGAHRGAVDCASFSPS